MLILVLLLSRLGQLRVLALKGLLFKLHGQNFDLIKISGQKYIIFQNFGKSEKYFNLCRNGKGTSVISNYVPPRGKSETGFSTGKR